MKFPDQELQINSKDVEKILAIAKIVEATKSADWILEAVDLGHNGHFLRLEERLKTSIRGIDFSIELNGEFPPQVVMESRFLIFSPTINSFIDDLIKAHKVEEWTGSEEIDYFHNHLTK